MTSDFARKTKRTGNYTPERIKVLEPEIADKYGTGQSAKSLGREYGISKNTVLNIAKRHGILVRGKADAGKLLRTVTPVSEAEANDHRDQWQSKSQRSTAMAPAKGFRLIETSAPPAPGSAVAERLTNTAPSTARESGFAITFQSGRVALA